MKEEIEGIKPLQENEIKLLLEDTKHSIGVVKQKRIEKYDLKYPLKNFLFIETIFENVYFSGNWSDIEMQNCIFKNCTFQQVKGIYISFIGSSFFDCTFVQSRIPKSDFTNCEFRNLQMTDSDLNRSNFSLSNYPEVNIKNCKIQNTLLEKVQQKETEKSEEIHKQLLLSYQVIEQLLSIGTDQFESASLKKIISDLHDFIEKEQKEQEVLCSSNSLLTIDAGDLEYRIKEHEKVVDSPVKISEIPVIDLSGHDFSGYNFQEHNLSCIDFSGSLLRNCCFAGCDLSGCNFSNCDMTGANMFHAHFNQVNFEHARLDNLILDNKNREMFIKAGIIPRKEMQEIKEGVYM